MRFITKNIIIFIEKFGFVGCLADISMSVSEKILQLDQKSLKIFLSSQGCLDQCPHSVCPKNSVCKNLFNKHTCECRENDDCDIGKFTISLT